MKNPSILLLLWFASALPILGQTCITNVTILDVENKKSIPHQAVVVIGEKISAIKPMKAFTPPLGAKVIDGSGKFLLPGLTDAHVHFFQSGGLYTRPDALDLRKYAAYENEIAWVHNNMEDLLKRYLQAGITTVVDVGATFSFLQQRDSFANKKDAPTIYMTGPLLTSYEPQVYKNLHQNEPFLLFSSVEDATAMVREQLPYHPDFIKIWYIVNQDSVESSARNYQPIVKAIIDESHKNNLKVAVHATERITAQLAVESGCDFLVHNVEDEIVSNEFVQLLKAKKTILCPTLIVAGNYYKTFGQKQEYSYADLRMSNPVQIGSLEDLKHLPDTAYVLKIKQLVNSENFIARGVREDSIRMVNLKKLTDAGITIVAGSDAGNIGTQHASSYLNELQAMQKSGLNNWQILQSATINPAKIFNKEKRTGSIAVDKTADMVLLNTNPLDDLRNLGDISLVFNKGYAIDPDTLIRETPLALVQRQLNAYNARNIEAFLEPYADDVELYEFPNKLLAKGKENMRQNYAGMFDELPDLHCEIKERIIQGNIIIDKESVSGMGKIPLEATVIYHIENNKISKVYFIQ